MSQAASIDLAAEPAPQRHGWGMLWTGLVLAVLGPAAGLVGTVLGMLASFREIETQRVPTPDDLAVGVNMSLIATTAGLLVGAVGIVLLIVAVIRLSRAASSTH